MTSEQILSKPAPPADARLHYGSDPNQFGELRVPASKGPHRIVTVIHGGFWRARYDLTHAGHLCAALTRAGIATWNLEYRRVGNEGGGWPGSFSDVLQGHRFLGQIANRFALDTGRSAVMGHSAGAQLALCLAARQHNLRGAVSLAGVVDLQRAWELHLSHDAVAQFLGGSPQQVPDHYKEASPLEIAIPRVAQRLIHGTADLTVPLEMSRNYVAAKRRHGEDATLLELAAAGHFELIDPGSPAWSKVQQLVEKLM